LKAQKAINEVNLSRIGLLQFHYVLYMIQLFPGFNSFLWSTTFNFLEYLEASSGSQTKKIMVVDWGFQIWFLKFLQWVLILLACIGGECWIIWLENHL